MRKAQAINKLHFEGSFIITVIITVHSLRLSLQKKEGKFRTLKTRSKKVLRLRILRRDHKSLRLSSSDHLLRTSSRDGKLQKTRFQQRVMAFADFDQRKGNGLAEESTYRPEIGEERVTARHGKLRPPSLAGD